MQFIRSTTAFQSFERRLSFNSYIPEYCISSKAQIKLLPLTRLTSARPRFSYHRLGVGNARRPWPAKTTAPFVSFSSRGFCKIVLGAKFLAGSGTFTNMETSIKYDFRKHERYYCIGSELEKLRAMYVLQMVCAISFGCSLFNFSLVILVWFDRDRDTFRKRR